MMMSHVFKFVKFTKKPPRIQMSREQNITFSSNKKICISFHIIDKYVLAIILSNDISPLFSDIAYCLI